MATPIRKRGLTSTAPMQEEAISALPGWAQHLARRYFTKVVSTFVCHGAVRDLHPGTAPTGERRYIPLKQFMSDELFPGRDYVLYYDRSSGVRMATPEMQRDLATVIDAYDSFHGASGGGKGVVPRDPGRALPIIENFARSILSSGKSIAVVVDYAETIAPAGDATTLSAEDRFTLVTLTRWAQDTTFLSRDFSLVLITDSMTELSARIT